MKRCVIAILFIIAASSQVPLKLPNYIKPCRAKDSTCLKNLLKELGPRLVQGIPELNLPSIDPWVVPDFNQSDPHSSQLTYSSSVTTMKYKGLSNFTVLNFDVDLDRSKFDLKLLFPQVSITANGVISATGFGVTVNGGGVNTATFSNLTITFSLNAVENLIDEKVHLKWKEDAITVSFDRVVHDVDAAFVDRENYLKILDVGIREHPEVLNAQMHKSIKTTLGELVLRSLNLVHEAYPLDVLYLTP